VCVSNWIAGAGVRNAKRAMLAVVNQVEKTKKKMPNNQIQKGSVGYSDPRKVARPKKRGRGGKTNRIRTQQKGEILVWSEERVGSTEGKTEVATETARKNKGHPLMREEIPANDPQLRRGLGVVDGGEIIRNQPEKVGKKKPTKGKSAGREQPGSCRYKKYGSNLVS